MATMTYVPSYLGEGFFRDVPVPGSGDDDKALTYDHGTGEFVYVAFDTAGTAAAAVAAHVVLSNPHDQYELESANTAAAILAKVLTVDGAGSGLDADLLDGQNGAYYLPVASFVPPGSTTQVLFNDGGVFGGDAGLTYAKATDRLTVAGGLVAPSMRPASDSTTALQWQNAAGTAVVTVDTTNRIVTMATANGQMHFEELAGYPGLAINAASTGSSHFVVTHQGGAYNGPTYVEFKNTANSGFGVDFRFTKFRVSAQPSSGDAVAIFNFNTLSAFGGYANAFTITGGFRLVDFVWKSYNIEEVYAERMRFTAEGYLGINTATPTALLDIAASTAARASIRSRIGVRPTSPNDGDLWTESDGWHTYIGGTEYILDMTPA